VGRLLVRGQLVALAGKVDTRVRPIAAVGMGSVGRPNLGALIQAICGGIVRASGDTVPYPWLLGQLPAPIITFEGSGLVYRALRQTQTGVIGRLGRQAGQHYSADHHPS
jgi:hypothetical protein